MSLRTAAILLGLLMLASPGCRDDAPKTPTDPTPPQQPISPTAK